MYCCILMCKYYIMCLSLPARSVSLLKFEFRQIQIAWAGIDNGRGSSEVMPGARVHAANIILQNSLSWRDYIADRCHNWYLSLSVSINSIKDTSTGGITQISRFGYGIAYWSANFSVQLFLCS